MSLAAACQPIKLILSDVDGVMTNGGIGLLDDGGQVTVFHIRDGMAVRLWREAGGMFGIVTGRDVDAVRRRAADLKIDILRQGVDDKLPVVDAVAEPLGLTRDEICYLGDDLLDLKCIQAVGLGVAVADAVEEVRHAASYVTAAAGGQAPLREVVELILKNTGQWANLLKRYSGDPG